MVLPFIEKLASGLSTNQFHPNLVSLLFPFFTAIIQRFSPHLDKSIQLIFTSCVHYWKSNLEELLDLVSSCNSLPFFADNYGIIIQQLLFILYDNTHCDNNERVSALVHLSENLNSLQNYLHLLLPAIQYTIQDHPDNTVIHILGINLIKDITYYLDISVNIELVTSTLGLLVSMNRTFLFKDIFDIVCIVAAKFSMQQAHSESIKITIRNRYFGTSERTVMPESEELMISLPLLYNQSIQGKCMELRDNLKIPKRDLNAFLLHSNGKKVISNMNLFITSFLDQYSRILCKLQYSHPNFELVHHAVRVYCSPN